MIHPFTLACALLAVGSGAWVYQSKHSAQMLDRDINRTMRAVDEARGRTGMLRAEYALLNDPSRLQELAEHHLALKTTQPIQFARLGDLSARLPAVGSFKPAEPDPMVQPIVTQPIAAQVIATQVVVPAPAALQVSAVAARVRPQARATGLVVAVAAPTSTAAAPRPTPAPAPRLLAASAIERVPLAPFDHVAAAPRPVRAATYVPAYAPATYQAPAYAVPAAAAEAIKRVARGGPVDPTVAVVASALGMARSMTPSPISSANAAPYDARGGARN